ncbi:MAG TPA: VIT1/CCC1 transporter family protein [Actinomycetota bacterium]
MSDPSPLGPRLAQKYRRLRRRNHPMLPHEGIVEGEQTAMGGRSGALRASVFGLNDGLVSNLSLIFGFAGASVDNNVVILAGIAGLLAGAFSMGAGEYVSMKVQRELFERLIHLEAHEIGVDPELERDELTGIYVERGIPRDLAERVSEAVMRDPRLALDTHAREELGLDPSELGSPWGAAGSSFVFFAIGAIVPVLPFLMTEGTAAVVTSALISGATLFAAGALLTRITGRPALLSGLRMLGIGAAAATITYVVGSLLGATVA